MYQHLAPRVAARPHPKAAAPPPVSAHTLRQQLRELGAEFDTLCRECIARVVSVLPATPAPRMLYADLQRGRPASLTTFGAAMAGASREPNAAAAIDAVAEKIAAWIRGLAQQPDEGLLGAWRQETKAQGEADLAVAEALVSPCVGSMDHAVATTARHLAAQQELLERLHVARRNRAQKRPLSLAGARS